jgi:hypothetical protein
LYRKRLPSRSATDRWAKEALVLYPCRCLCLGSLLQITITTPWRRITLQCSQRGFTDARTFTTRLLKNTTLMIKNSGHCLG